MEKIKEPLRNRVLKKLLCSSDISQIQLKLRLYFKSA